VARVLVTAGECDAFTGGLRDFQVEAADVRGLLRALEQRFPGLGELMETRVALAVDGEIIPAWTGPLRPDSEVALIPRLGGG
jgi:molybdopterin converting factor small subunit